MPEELLRKRYGRPVSSDTMAERTNNSDNINNLGGTSSASPVSIELQPLTSGNLDTSDTFKDEPTDATTNAIDGFEFGSGSDGGNSSHKIIDVDAPWNLQDWLYPPHLPPELQLLRRENIAIPACYLLVGILQGLSGPLINVYPLDLNATEAQQVTISTLKSLPASLKLIFGFLSDNFPILGYRRKSYMLIGWTMSAAAYGSLLFTNDLTLSEEEYEKDDGSIGIKTVVPLNAPSIPFFCLITFLFGTGEYNSLTANYVLWYLVFHIIRMYSQKSLVLILYSLQNSNSFCSVYAQCSMQAFG